MERSARAVSAPALTGVLRVDKPEGPTSHDVVAVVRRAVGQRRVGHAGTLDPPATGLLIVLLGAATRLQSYALGRDKTYTFTLVLGVETDTLDQAGVVTREETASVPDDSTLKAAIASLTGDIELIPPMVSAIHHEGERLYRLARQGREVERAPRPSRIDELVALAPARADPDGRVRVPMRVSCSSGTYVRSLAHALAAKLGVPGSLDALRRTRIGAVEVDGAATLEAIAGGGRAFATGALLPPESLVAHLPEVTLDEEDARRFLNGNMLARASAATGEVRVSGPSGFLGVGESGHGRLLPRKVLAERDSTHD